MKAILGKRTRLVGKQMLHAESARPGDKIIGIDLGQMRPKSVRIKSVSTVEVEAYSIGQYEEKILVSANALSMDGFKNELKIVDGNIHIFKSKRPVKIDDKITKAGKMEMICLELEDAGCAPLVSNKMYIVFDKEAVEGKAIVEEKDIEVVEPTAELEAEVVEELVDKVELEEEAPKKAKSKKKK